MIPDLVNQSGIARRLHVVPSTVAMWRQRDPGFPQPLHLPGIEGSAVFLWSDVEEWLRASGRGRWLEVAA